MPDPELVPELRRLLVDAQEARHRLRRLAAAVAVTEEVIADLLDEERSRKLAIECRQLLGALDAHDN